MYLGVCKRSLPWQVHLLQRPVEDPLKSQGEAASLEFQGWSQPSWAGGAQQGGCKLFTRLYSLSFLICSHTRHPQCPMEGAFRPEVGGVLSRGYHQLPKRKGWHQLGLHLDAASWGL